MSDKRGSRRGERVKIAAIATLETTGRYAGNQALCTVRDLSRTGIGLETGQPPMPGQVVRLRLALGNRTFVLRTLATRVERRPGSNFYSVGLDWSKCAPEELAFLDEVLESVEPEEASRTGPKPSAGIESRPPVPEQSRATARPAGTAASAPVPGARAPAPARNPTGMAGSPPPPAARPPVPAAQNRTPGVEQPRQGMRGQAPNQAGPAARPAGAGANPPTPEARQRGPAAYQHGRSASAPVPPVANRAPTVDRTSAAPKPAAAKDQPPPVAARPPQVGSRNREEQPPELDDEQAPQEPQRHNLVDDYPSLVDADPVAAGEDRDVLDGDQDSVDLDTDPLDADHEAVDEDPDAPNALGEDPDAVDPAPDTEEAHPTAVEHKPAGGRPAPSKPVKDRGGKDTRRGKRVKASGIATLETGGLNATNQAVCTVRDLSRSGIGLETGQPPEVGQVVRLRLVLNGQMVTLNTIATRVDRRQNSNFYQVGLDWSRCRPEELEFLNEVLKAVEPPSRVKR